MAMKINFNYFEVGLWMATKINFIAIGFRRVVEGD
jgi:hypothetical protein